MGLRCETERLLLRDWRESDWEPFWRLTNTPAVMRWLGGVLDGRGMAEARGRLEGYARDHGHTFWVVERKTDGGHLSGEMLGFCGLKRANQPGGPQGDFEVGWRLREDAWGHGYALEAARAALDMAFGRFGAPHVIALTVPGNEASWGLMRRLGMQRREDLDFDFDGWDVETGRVIAYRLDREAWPASRA
ncbi:MAG: GNAT family N-acetyltransferase [Novosphingobium sp.]|nr:GNAT family N-acetyltransferase [Novosphingobium sp.]